MILDSQYIVTLNQASELQLAQLTVVDIKPQNFIVMTLTVESASVINTFSLYVMMFFRGDAVVSTASHCGDNLQCFQVHSSLTQL